MNEWNDGLKFSKRAPTNEELTVIEKELDGIDLKEGFEIEAEKKITKEEFKEKTKSLTKKELKIIDEMIRIVEDPHYISEVRKRRLAMKEEDDAGISFDNATFGGEFNSSYGEDFDPQY